ncbi:MAG TPA: phage tail protein [Blastocatellia bacterium]|nr:phage tail protein [Blastocatellia bacterium]
MSTPFMGEIKFVSFNFAPKGWAMCNGQLLPINQNQALFSILGTVYGGDGRVNFALPEFRGRVPVHRGNGITEGQSGGQESHTVTMSEMPAHNHFASASNLADANNTNVPSGNIPANSSVSPYRSAITTTLAPNSVTNFGGSQPHENRQPYLVINFIIALQGIFPSQN